MSNSRAVNLRADRLKRERQRQQRAPSGQCNNAYHDRVRLDTDIQDVQARDTSRRAHPTMISRSPVAPWIVSSTWEPVDDTEVGLDSSSDLFDQAFTSNIITVDSPAVVHQRKINAVWLHFNTTVITPPY
jgi:hypothetical protein